MAILVNPAVTRLGSENAVLRGRGRQHHVREFSGPLSIKAVIRGTAEWRVNNCRFELDANSYLVVNHDQPYSITVESAEPVETLCLFFARGFVEDAWSSLTRPAGALLDHPDRHAPVGFYERLRRHDSRIAPVLAAVHDAVRHDALDDAEALFYQAALGLCELREELTDEVGRVPALRASTREELHRRLLRGKHALDKAFDQRQTLAEIARIACLSPFHFHRAFTLAFHETPHAYRTRRRLEHAARLLAETDRMVIDVCLDAGFESPASFSTLFRRRFGRSPRRFREFARSDKNSVLFYGRMLP